MAALVLGSGVPAVAQDWPTKPIKIIVPYAPGGITDIAARLIGAGLTQAWKQQVVVENRSGGAGTIGMALAAKAPPDGYTLLFATLGDFVITPYAMTGLSYDMDKNFVPITTLTDTDCAIATPANSKYKTLADAIADARKQPGMISYGTPGNGSVNHILMEAVALETGTKLQHIPYKGGGPSGAAVAAGDVPLGLLAISSAFPHLKSGRVRLLAVTAEKRIAQFPDVPTLKEAGVPNVSGTNYTGALAVKGTSPAIIDKLHAEFVKILSTEETKKRLAGIGAVPIPVAPADFAARMRREAASFKRIVARAKIQMN
jgi:tripartite-type tricarboxylate transporter receptor subunit TctC